MKIYIISIFKKIEIFILEWFYIFRACRVLRFIIIYHLEQLKKFNLVLAILRARVIPAKQITQFYQVIKIMGVDMLNFPPITKVQVVYSLKDTHRFQTLQVSLTLLTSASIKYK